MPKYDNKVPRCKSNKIAMYCMRNISMHTLHDLDLEITHINSPNILFQTQTNAKSALTIVARMPPASTPKVLLTVVANQGTEEMVTTVQVGGQLQSFFLFSRQF